MLKARWTRRIDCDGNRASSDTGFGLRGPGGETSLLTLPTRRVTIAGTGRGVVPAICGIEGQDHWEACRRDVSVGMLPPMTLLQHPCLYSSPPPPSSPEPNKLSVCDGANYARQVDYSSIPRDFLVSVLLDPVYDRLPLHAHRTKASFRNDIQR
jgi:hypothetical protein